MESASQEMPRYKSHKTVWALKISKVEPLPNPDLTGQSAAMHYGATLTPEDTGYAPFAVDASYQAKHNPQPGGYYVVYADGYKSFSPAKAFEEGNRLVVSGESVHQDAINALTIAAETCENNSPIHAAEANAEQAACSKANAEGYRAAIAYLETWTA